MDLETNIKYVEDSSFARITLYVGVFIIFTLAALKICKKQKEYEIPARDVSKGHKWSCCTPFIQPMYCNICEMLAVNGFQCDCCKICTDQPCLSKADKHLPCKALAVHGLSFEHHWIKGNLPPDSVCDICAEDCGVDQGLSDYRCCWCQRTVHTYCLKKTGKNCDLGRFKDFIVPPNYVKLRLVGWKGRRHLIVSEVKPSSSDAWSPLIVIANRKSGSNEGEMILRDFRGILNPAQVIDLHDLPPENGLEWCRLLQNTTCRVLVAGGDGTIGWVLSTINKLDLNPRPVVAIVPLGTGNDLSRVLGWGDGSNSSTVNVEKILVQIEKAEMVKLDCWKLKTTSVSHLGIRLPYKELFMNNYASVGVDALVTLNFHKTRESKLYFMGNRLLNKLLFISYGTKDIWERECKNLHKKVVLWLDGNEVNLPEIEAIVFLNIPCWGAGVRPWTLGNAPKIPKQKIDDGMLEVFGVYSSFHIAQMQVGLSEPVRLGQAKSIKLRLLEKVPMQVDGEPWEQSPGMVEISYCNQAYMLSCKNV